MELREISDSIYHGKSTEKKKEMNAVYYETGSAVYANIPVGYTRGESDVQVTMYAGGEMLTGFAVDEENCLVWAEK